jgi:uncharacterized RDD family membrane protein YckC
VAGGAISIFGNTTVNFRVGMQAVAILGNVIVGPKAEIGGNVIAIGGTVKRDDGAVIHGSVTSIAFPGSGNFEWLHAWMTHCLLLGRPLAFGSDLGLVWAFALGGFAIYLLLAALCRDAVERCERTLTTRPGGTALTAVLTGLLAPIIAALLVFSVFGIVLLPFFGAGLTLAAMFGQVTLLAWIGRKFVNPATAGRPVHPVLAVLVGGIAVLPLYLIPAIGLLVFLPMAWLGLGAVIYTLLLGMRCPPATALKGEGTATMRPDSNGPEAASPGELAVFAARSSVLAHPRAGFWIRLVALAIDGILVGLIVATLAHNTRGPNVLFASLGIYAVILWKLRGSTIGGIICGLKVVRLDDRPIDWATALVRALGCFLSAVPAGLGFIWAAFDHEKQSWHDKIAGTVVVRWPKGVSLV